MNRFMLSLSMSFAWLVACNATVWAQTVPLPTQDIRLAPGALPVYTPPSTVIQYPNPSVVPGYTAGQLPAAPIPLAPGLPAAPASAPLPPLPDVSKLPGPITTFPRPALPPSATPLLPAGSMITVAAGLGQAPLYLRPEFNIRGRIGSVRNGTQLRVAQAKQGLGGVGWYYVTWEEKDERVRNIECEFRRAWIAAGAVRPVSSPNATK